MRYLLVDTANTFFRARHSAHRQSDMWDKLGFAIHITLTSVGKSWRDQSADHVIFFLEGRSWRKDFYEPYKKNRTIARAALTEQEAEEDQLFWEAFDNLTTFIMDKTNCTVLQHPELEADDLISGWIHSHPDDHHTIISSDSDFHQLLSTNVNQYNGIADELHTLEGIFDNRGRLVIDKKTKQPKTIPDPRWILFEKCMRGDSSDNVFSAYPGVRKKGSKKNVGLQEAFEDIDSRGYAWNNIMQQEWIDHDGVKHLVRNDYERNKTLIDLTAQPDDIKVKISETISTNSVSKNVPMVGLHFLKFCGKYDLVKLSESATPISAWLGAPYPEKSI